MCYVVPAPPEWTQVTTEYLAELYAEIASLRAQVASLVEQQAA